MSSNGSTIADNEGDYSDWIELYNPGSTNVDLTGYGISDDPERPYRWVFSNVSIPAQSFLLIWASGKDKHDDQVHTNFAISAEGEKISLTHPSGFLVDAVEPTVIPRDVSFGRFPDGTGSFSYFEEPTPGMPNHATAFEGILSPAVFSTPSQVYINPFFLNLTAEEGASIFYTVDGSVPTPEEALLYEMPILIEETSLIRAITHQNGKLPGHVVSHFFARIDKELTEFSSNLPLVILFQFDTLIDQGDRSSTYQLFYNLKSDGRSYLKNQPDLFVSSVTNVRGSSSAGEPKKMFGFHMLEEDGGNRKESLFGLPEEHNWILYAPYKDKTLIRNNMAYGLSNEMGRYAPLTKFVELFLHNGYGKLSYDHYHGVYELTQRIKWGEGNVNIAQMEVTDNAWPEISGGYIFKNDRLNPGESGFRTARGSRFAHVRPSEEDITSTQKQWLVDYISEFESALFGRFYRDPEIGYGAYIDIGSFIDFHIMEEFAKEIDGFRLSTFMHIDREGKLSMGPLWDFDRSFGNSDHINHRGWDPVGWYYATLNQDQYLKGWYTRMMADPEFNRKYRERWYQLRRGALSDANVMSRIDSMALLLEESQERNFTRWPILGIRIFPNWFVGKTYEEEIEWLKDWTKARSEWMDEQLGKPSQIIHYWHFNNLNNYSLPFVPADSSAISAKGIISYPGSGDGYMDRVNDGTLMNAISMISPGMALRVRNPATTRHMLLQLPTTGFENISLSYAVKRTTNGPAEQNLAYRTHPDDEWIPIPGHVHVEPNYKYFSFHFQDVKSANNNPHFQVRISLLGDGTEGPDGNNRFDNISVSGFVFDPSDPPTSIDDRDKTSPYNTGVQIHHQNARLSIQIPFEGSSDIKIFDMQGREMATFVAGGNEQAFFSFPATPGIYIAVISNPGGIEKERFVVLR